MTRVSSVAGPGVATGETGSEIFRVAREQKFALPAVDSQEFIAARQGTGPKPVSFVFHGRSGSEQSDIREAVSYGVVNINIDTDTQRAAWPGVLDHYRDKEGYLQGQIGNPDGDDQLNKKHYDPRAWLRQAELALDGRRLPAERRKTNRFPTGEMRVVETYRVFDVTE